MAWQRKNTDLSDSLSFIDFQDGDHEEMQLIFRTENGKPYSSTPKRDVAEKAPPCVEGTLIVTDPLSTKPSHPTSPQKQSNPERYIPKFNTKYLLWKVEEICKRHCKDFSLKGVLDASICMNRTRKSCAVTYGVSANTRAQIEDHERSCMCCWCNLHQKSTQTVDFCIKKHPKKASRRKSHHNFVFKYQQNVICTDCCQSLFANTKRNGKKNHYCCKLESCKGILKGDSKLLRHCLEHLKVAPYVCGICNKQYKTKTSFKKHELRHVKN